MYPREGCSLATGKVAANTRMQVEYNNKRKHSKRARGVWMALCPVWSYTLTIKSSLINLQTVNTIEPK